MAVLVDVSASGSHLRPRAGPVLQGSAARRKPQVKTMIGGPPTSSPIPPPISHGHIPADTGTPPSSWTSTPTKPGRSRQLNLGSLVRYQDQARSRATYPWQSQLSIGFSHRSVIFLNCWGATTAAICLLMISQATRLSSRRVIAGEVHPLPSTRLPNRSGDSVRCAEGRHADCPVVAAGALLRSRCCTHLGRQLMAAAVSCSAVTGWCPGVGQPAVGGGPAAGVMLVSARRGAWSGSGRAPGAMRSRAARRPRSGRCGRPIGR